MRSVLAAVIFLCLVAACASIPPLAPRSGGNPQQVDLTGRWALRGAAAAPRSNEQLIRIPAASARNQSQWRRSKSRSDGSSIHVFLTAGKDLKISQTVYALFLSFDRAIVREYNFGENRTISIGPIEAQRVSGWDEATYVVETMSENGEVLTERWSLAESGDALTRDISIRQGETNSVEMRQVFDRR